MFTKTIKKIKSDVINFASQGKLKQTIEIVCYYTSRMRFRVNLHSRVD